ncbi:MAG: ATP-binding protein, partial [Muribaculaceae bacterium]|nr:ATP-binding protein [Muribaculaceae bacterium]
MKESIIIRNIGPLKNIYITEIPSFTVFIGPSGSGKSMLMKIVILMRYVFKLICIRSYLKNSGISKSPFKISIDGLLRDDLKAHIPYESKAEIIYKVISEAGVEYCITYKDKKLYLPSNIPDTDIHFSKESWVSEMRNVIPSWIANPANSKGSLGFCFQETLTDFTEA